MGTWEIGDIDNSDIGTATPAKGYFTEVKASVDPVDDDGVGDRGYNDGRYVGGDTLDANSIIKADVDNTPIVLPIAEQRIVGRITGGSITDLTVAQSQTLLNIEDGATGDQSASEIRALVESATDSNVFTDSDHTKLNGIEANATIDQVASEVPNTPSGTIAATDVQAALNELDSEKLANLVEDITPQLGGNLDGQGNYLVDVQNVPDLAMRGAGYHTDGTNDSISSTNDLNLTFSDDMLTLECDFICSSLGSDSVIIAKDQPSKREYYLRIYSSGDIGLFLFSVDGLNYSRFNVSAGTIAVDTHYHVLVSYDGSDVTFWINSKEYSTTKTDGGSGFPGFTHALAPLTVSGTGAGSLLFHGAIMSARGWNMVVTNEEAIELSSGGMIPYKYLGASQAVLTSGTLTIGKRYSVDTFVVGDDFVNIGGANASGSIFTASGTTPTVWTNGSSLRQIGCVLQLEQDGINHGKWLDKSGNALHGTVDGAIPTNLSLSHREQYPHITSITTDTIWTNVVPAGYMLNHIVFEGENANTATIDLGTTSGASDVFSQQIITGSSLTTVVLNKIFSKTATQSLYLNDDGTGTWNGASVLATLYMSRIEG